MGRNSKQNYSRIYEWLEENGRIKRRHSPNDLGKFKVDALEGIKLMGRWMYSNRRTVEECKSITTKFLNQHHYFDGGIRWGGVNWSRKGEKVGSIGFVVSTVEGDEYISFQYTQTDNYSGEKTELDYKVRFVSTPCHFGGLRWWFICPLIVNGRACNRRVGVLYLGGGKYFGCRHCYNLTYTSCKESHKYDRLFALIAKDVPGATPDMVKKILSEKW